MTGDPDLELVKGCLSREPTVREESFAALFHKYENDVYNTAFRITGDAQLAYDASQETFLCVHQKLRHFRFQARFSSWLYRIAVNYSIDRKRKASKEPTISSEGGGIGSAEVVTEAALVDRKSTSPERVLWDKEFESKVQEVVVKLSAPLRVVVVLRFISGLSYGEIGEVLDCSVGTVKSRLSRALKALEPQLARLLEESRKGSAR